MLVVLVALFGAGVYLLSFRSVTIVVDGSTYTFETSRRQVESILARTGISIRAEDRVVPAPDQRLKKEEMIIIERAVWAQFWQDGELSAQALTSARTPAGMLEDAGLAWSSNQILRWNGAEVALDAPMPRAAAYVFAVESPRSFSVMLDGAVTDKSSFAPTLASALWQEGIHLGSADAVSTDLEQPLTADSRVVIELAREIIIETEHGILRALSSASTVDGALVDAGLPLQQMDYTQPAADQPVPEDGSIQLTRVNEQFVLVQIPIPYGRKFEPSAELELDRRDVIEPGQYGLEVQRTRIRYEADAETARMTEAQWVASEPRDEVLGYGQKIVTRTIDTEYGPLEYYRAVKMYATSYRPCAFSDGCHYTTASGMTVQKGVVALAVPWYRAMAGQEVYVPGYGRAVVGDAGGGIPGRYWIDLAYSDDDYVGWHHWVTVYFLTPVPETILWILP